MHASWKSAPTTAAQVVRRAMQERDWRQKDVAQETGLDAHNVSRWATGKVNPPEQRVAEIAALLGYDPREFGITSPHALAKAEQRSTQHEAPPDWAVRQHDEIMEALRAVIRKIESRTKP